jgi:hypothetical protein
MVTYHQVDDEQRRLECRNLVEGAREKLVVMTL